MNERTSETSTTVAASVQSDVAVQEFQDKLSQLDLEPLKVKLMDADEGQGWSLAEADQAEVRYKQFLLLVYKYPDASVVPTDEIDSFWHAHILDTRKYFRDCDELFGHYLHHFPYLGMRGKADKEQLQSSFRQTLELFEQEFGGLQSSPGEVSTCGYQHMRTCDCYTGQHGDPERPRPARPDRVVH